VIVTVIVMAHPGMREMQLAEMLMGEMLMLTAGQMLMRQTLMGQTLMVETCMAETEGIIIGGFRQLSVCCVLCFAVLVGWPKFQLVLLQCLLQRPQPQLPLPTMLILMLQSWQILMRHCMATECQCRSLQQLPMQQTRQIIRMVACQLHTQFGLEVP